MELLLWLFFYDSRWFFGSKASVNTLKLLWYIPLLSHIIFVSYCAFILISTKITKEFHPIILNDIFNDCRDLLKLWIYSRIVFSFLISFFIIFFQIKSSKIESEEKKFFRNAEAIFPMVPKDSSNYDYWIIRKSLMSCEGIALFFLGIISFLWSFIMINFHYLANKFQGCDYNLILTINVISIFIFVGNIPVLILFFFTVLLKINSFFCSYLCPKVLIWLSRQYNHNLVKFEVEHNCNK